ncbi:MAG: hypothetical protein JWQ72_3348, partial [Polaromonas sp.]|nr:hypothetical protein [Polaromonas sp.]
MPRRRTRHEATEAVAAAGRRLRQVLIESMRLNGDVIKHPIPETPMPDHDRRSPPPRRNDDTSQDVRNALTDREIEALNKAIADLTKTLVDLSVKVDSLIGDRSKFLVWGVLTLGAAVVGM